MSAFDCSREEERKGPLQKMFSQISSVIWSGVTPSGPGLEPSTLPPKTKVEQGEFMVENKITGMRPTMQQVGHGVVAHIDSRRGNRDPKKSWSPIHMYVRTPIGSANPGPFQKRFSFRCYTGSFPPTS